MHFNLTKLFLAIAFAGILGGILVVALDKPNLESKPISIVVSPSGNRIATQNETGDIRVYDIGSGNSLIASRAFQIELAEINFRLQNHIDFLDEDQIAISRNHWQFNDSDFDAGFFNDSAMDLSQECKIWDIRHKRVLERDELVQDSAYHVLARNRVARIMAERGQIEIADLITEKTTSSFVPVDIRFSRDPKDDSYASVFMKLTPDGEKIYIAYFTGGHWSPGTTYEFGAGQVRLDVFEVRNGLQVSSTTIDFLNFQVSPSGKYLLAIQDGRIVLLDRYMEPLGHFGKPDRPGFQFQFAPDEKTFAHFAEGKSSIDIYEIRGRTRVSQIPVEGACQFVFSPDSQQLIVFPENGEKGLEFWNPQTAELEKRIFGKNNPLWPAVFFGIGLVVWSIVFGWLGREKPDLGNEEDDQADVANTEVALAEVAEDTDRNEAIAAELVSSHQVATPSLKIAWSVLVASGIWGITWGLLLIFYFRTQYDETQPLIQWYLVFAAMILITASSLSISHLFRGRAKGLRLAGFRQCLSLLAAEPVGVLLGLFVVGISFLPLQQEALDKE